MENMYIWIAIVVLFTMVVLCVALMSEMKRNITATKGKIGGVIFQDGRIHAAKDIIVSGVSYALEMDEVERKITDLRNEIKAQAKQSNFDRREFIKACAHNREDLEKLKQTVKSHHSQNISIFSVIRKQALANKNCSSTIKEALLSLESEVRKKDLIEKARLRSGSDKFDDAKELRDLTVEEAAEKLDIATRARNGLLKTGSDCANFGEFLALPASTILRQPNFGMKSFKELQAALAAHGIEWGKVVYGGA